MNILISNVVRVYEYDHTFERWVKDKYTIKNPEYITRVKLNKWLGRTPKTLLLAKITYDYIELGYGCMRDVIEFAYSRYGKDQVKVVADFNLSMKADWSGEEYELRVYQLTAVKHMLQRKFGILKAPCSSGKTIMGHAIAKAVGKKTLWVTHTKDLLEQSKEVGVHMLGAKRVGTITNGKVKIGQTITYATVQTLAKIDPLIYEREFDCVIVDECHRCVTKASATQMAQVVGTIKASRKYGLSATPETHDGYFKTILCTIGNIEYEIDKDELEENNSIMPVEICPVLTEFTYPNTAYRADGTLDWGLAVDALANDRERNVSLCKLIGDKSTLILSNKIDQLINIMNELPVEKQEKACLLCTDHDEEKVTAIFVRRGHNKTERAKMLEDMKSGKLLYMFATYQLAKEGLNIPRLENVIMAFPPVDDNIITQSIGRVARTCPGKERAVCYDVVDKPTYFRKKFQARKKLYRKLGYKLINQEN